MPPFPLIAGVPAAIPGLNPDGGTVNVICPSLASSVYLKMWIGGIQVQWLKVQPASSDGAVYPPGCNIDVLAGADMNLSITLS